eukprot:2467325-Rhodomonas_salina.2
MAPALLPSCSSPDRVASSAGLPRHSRGHAAQDCCRKGPCGGVEGAAEGLRRQDCAGCGWDRAPHCQGASGGPGGAGSARSKMDRGRTGRSHVRVTERDCTDPSPVTWSCRCHE